MVKYLKEEIGITFEEIPNEITLCLNITNCQMRCNGCHSPYLREDIGEILDFNEIDELIKKNDGITCVCLMGEGNDTESLEGIISYLEEKYPHIKRALYSGRDNIPEEFFWRHLNYLKIGGYKEERGPLNKPTTNQRLYNFGWFQVIDVGGTLRDGWKDITDMFWKN